MNVYSEQPKRAVFNSSMRLAASAERIFSVWLEPKMIRRWMSLSTGTDPENVEVTVDPRVGGRFFMVDRTEGYPLEHEGAYLAIEPFRLLEFSYTMPQYGRDIDHITISVRPVEGGCQMDIQHELDPEWAEQIDRVKQGWNRSLKAIKVVAESAE